MPKPLVMFYNKRCINDPTGAIRLSVRRTEDGDCIRWTGAHTPTGYGQMKISGKTLSVHRIAWELVNGPLPDGQEIDHNHAKGCRFRDCIKVEHLDAVTHKENLRRITKRRTACVNGHPYTNETVVMRGNSRVCRICRREKSLIYKQNKRERSAKDAA